MITRAKERQLRERTTVIATSEMGISETTTPNSVTEALGNQW